MLVLAYCREMIHNLKQNSYQNLFRFTAHEIFVIHSYKPLCSELKHSCLALFHDPITILMETRHNVKEEQLIANEQIKVFG